jgi:ABC-2 type transport system permease protein
MRREGSPWQGLNTVVLKELADHSSSVRMFVLQLIVMTLGFTVLYGGAITKLQETTSEDPFLLLRLFTTDRSPFPPFASVLELFLPLMAIGLGFDAINGEHNRRTLSRILAQPIYRDALLAGKFLAGLATLAISLIGLWLLVVGVGIFFLGVPPSGEEIARSLVFLVLALAYASVWLALAMLLSVVFRSAATAALIALGVWLFFAEIWPMLAQALGEVIAPPDDRYQLLGLPTPATLEWTEALARLSPTRLFQEVIAAVLSPDTRSLGPIFLSQLQGAVLGAPLPLGQSLMLAWPQAVSLIATTIVLFVIGYISFQRQEVRA